MKFPDYDLRFGICRLAPLLLPVRLSLVVGACVFALNLSAQTPLTADGLAALPTASASGGGGGGGGGNTFTLVAHSIGTASSTTTATTAARDITGAKLIVVSIANFNSSGADTGPSDGVNTFLPLTIKGPPTLGTRTNQMWYVINPTTSSTYTVSAKRNYTTITMAAFSYSGTTPALDGQAAGAGADSSTTIQPGSLTPSGTELFVTGVACANTITTSSVNSSFTGTDAGSPAAGLFGGMAYKSSSTAEDPTWTQGSAGGIAANMAKFK